MKKNIVLALTAIAIFSCKNKEGKTVATPAETVEIEETATVNPLQMGCYTFDNDGNTIVFEITGTGNNVTGNLNYSLRGKDTNNGSFKGIHEGNTVIGTYTFTSEGVESTREVAFLVKDGQLIEGYGELDVSGTKFTDKESIAYTSTMPLVKTECPDK